MILTITYFHHPWCRTSMSRCIHEHRRCQNG